jgi:hypothetical protein
MTLDAISHCANFGLYATLVGERCPAAGCIESVGNAQEAKGVEISPLQVRASSCVNDSGTGAHV